MTATVANTHPLYDRHLHIWRKIKDVLEGEEEVKRKGTDYLAMSPAMAAETDTNKQLSHYRFYSSFAELPDFTSQTHNNMIGMITRKPVDIKVPAGMEYILDSMDGKGTPAQDFFKNMIGQTVAYGRYGLLTDAPSDGGDPYIRGYNAFDIINWNEDKQDPQIDNGGSGHLDLVVLDESYNSKDERNIFERALVHRYRVLFFFEGEYYVQVWQGISQSQMDQLKDRGTDDSTQTEVVLIDEVKIETVGDAFTYIPFVVAGSKNNDIDPDAAPMAPIARKALDIFRKRASYGRAIFMTGDPTPVISGISDGDETPEAIGSTTVWTFGDPTAQARFLDVEGKGLESQRQAIMDDFEEAGKYGATLIQTARNGVESGDALRIRLQNQTADAVTLSINAGQALAHALRSCARFLNLNPDEVSVSPNLDFVEQRMFGQDLLNYMAAKNQGAPLSNKSLHELMKKGELTNMEYDEEVAEIESEEPLGENMLNQIMMKDDNGGVEE